MDRTNKITTIFLKLVAIVAIMVVSYFYCHNLGNDRYILQVTSGMILLDKRTGEVYLYYNEEKGGIISGQWEPVCSFPDQKKGE